VLCKDSVFACFAYKGGPDAWHCYLCDSDLTSEPSSPVPNSPAPDSASGTLPAGCHASNKTKGGEGLYLRDETTKTMVLFAPRNTWDSTKRVQVPDDKKSIVKLDRRAPMGAIGTGVLGAGLVVYVACAIVATPVVYAASAIKSIGKGKKPKGPKIKNIINF